MTWVDVASDAVKIGLGAVVGGIFSIMTASRSHRFQLDAEYSRRRRDALEKIALEFDALALEGSHRAQTWTLFYAQQQLDEDAPLGDVTAQLQQEITQRPLSERSTALKALNARAALLGFSDLSKALESYWDTFSSIDQADRGKENKVHAFAYLLGDLDKKRESVLSAMAHAYKAA